MTLPLVELSGSAFEQGWQHGRALRDRIGRNLRIYAQRFAAEGKLTQEEVHRRAAAYLEVITRTSREYHQGLQGLAAGSGFHLLDLTALNARYEILYHQFAHPVEGPAPEGCSAFLLMPPATLGRHLILGQNWDWIPQVEGAVLHVREADGLRILCFTEAGVLGGKIGLNSAGLGLLINGLHSTEDDWSRLKPPFHQRCHEILRRRDLPGAVSVVTGEDRSCSTNFLLGFRAAGEEGAAFAIDLEAAPERFRALQPQGDRITHTNHFLDPEALPVHEPPDPLREGSHARRDRLERLLQGRRAHGMEDLAEILRDHTSRPQAICRHDDGALPPEEVYVTRASVIMDLDMREMWYAEGPPCRASYQRVRVDGTG